MKSIVNGLRAFLRLPSNLECTGKDFDRVGLRLQNGKIQFLDLMYFIENPTQYANYLPAVEQARADIQYAFPNEYITRIPANLGHTVVLDCEWDTDNKLVRVGLTDGESYVVLDSWEGLQELLDSDRIFVSHNGNTDRETLAINGFKYKYAYDTMIMSYIINELPLRLHGLKAQTRLRLGLEYQTINYKNMRSVPKEELNRYLVNDLYATFQLYGIYKHHKEYDEWLNTFLMRVNDLLYDIKVRGFPIDVPGLEQLWEEAEQTLANLHATLDNMTGGTVNFNSPKQLSNFLYETMGLRKPSGQYITGTATNKHAFVKLDEWYPDNEFLRVFREWRKVDKLLSTYIRPLRTQQRDGWIYPTYFIQGTEIGRLSAKNPPFQTIPKAYTSVFAARLRRCFKAPPGYKLVIADYSQAELRVAGQVSCDAYLADVYLQELDIHSSAAEKLFGPNYTSEHRRFAKNLNFSFIYGGNEYSFASQSALPIQEASRIMGSYKKLMRGVVQFRDETQPALARKQGYVETIFKRRRRFPFILNTKAFLTELKKAATHSIIAGTANDFGLMSAVILFERGYRVIGLVHDSIMILETEEKAEETASVMKQVMIDTASEWMTRIRDSLNPDFPVIPFKVDVEITEWWE